MLDENLNISPKDIFICYRGSNSDAISVGMELFYKLEYATEPPVPCFFAPRTIPKGHDFKDRLGEYFKSVKVVVLLLTPGFFDSCSDEDDVVDAELKTALENPRMCFIPVIFDGFTQKDFNIAANRYGKFAVNRFKHKSAYNFRDIYSFDINAFSKTVIHLRDNPVLDLVRKNLESIGDEAEHSEKGDISGLPLETLRSFEIIITKYATEYSKDEQCVEDLRALLKGNDEDDITYYAYYCLHILYRRRKDYDMLEKMIKEHHHRFENHPTANHIWVTHYVESGHWEDKRDELLEKAYSDAVIYKDKNAGFVHLFPVAYATVMESVNLPNREAFFEKWHKFATDAVDNAIALDSNYAKYYCTKARLLAIEGEYDLADKFVQKAISVENSERKDYFLRIGDYQYYRTMIRTEQQIYNLQQKLQGLNGLTLTNKE